jgi:signal transduction histidine kinase
MFEREGFMDPMRMEQVVVYPIIEKEDEESAAIMRISDITDEKMLQRQIVQSEKLASLGFLVSGVAHEINNPNNLISFNIPILKEYLSKINRMVKSFEVDIPEDLPGIYTDSETIETVVINLLINAAQAVDKENSWIRLNVTLDDSPQNYLIIEVSDNGCGLDEKIKNNIFDPFFTTKPPGEGTGLGLTLCHNSIEKLGGRIKVDSVPGKGSTFKVTLPGNDIKNTKHTA